MRRAPKRRPAFTLLDMIVIFMALGVCMLMGTVLIAASMKANHVVHSTANRIQIRHDLATQFRQDVARSDFLPARAGERPAGPQYLILSQPHGSFVIYAWDDGKLERIEQTREKESRRPVPLGAPGVRVEFVTRGEASGVVTLRLTEQRGNETQRCDISAALGGDLR